MRSLQLTMLATLASIATAVPLSVHIEKEHEKILEARATLGKLKDFGACEFEVKDRVAQPPFPGGPLVVTLDNTNLPKDAAKREALFGAAGDQYPHWYHYERYKGNPTDPTVTVTILATNEPRLTSVVAPATETIEVNSDHVFERFTLRQYMARQMGMGDPLVAGSTTRSTPPMPECAHWVSNFGGKPRYYDNRSKAVAEKGLLFMVFQHLQGYDEAFPKKYVQTQGEFAGLSKDLNGYKGLVMAGNMQELFASTGRPIFHKGTTEADLVNRMVDIEGLTAAFEFMKKPEIAAIHAKTCRRLSTVLNGVDEFITRGNKASFTAANAPFRKADGVTPYPSFRGQFQAWLTAFLTAAQTDARTFIRARIAELQRDTAATSTVTATNKAEVARRLQELITAGRDQDAFLTIPIASMIDVAPATEIKHLYQFTGTETPDPLKVAPFGNFR